MKRISTCFLIIFLSTAAFCQSAGVMGVVSSSGQVSLQTETSAFISRLIALGESPSNADINALNDLVYYWKNTMGNDGTTSLWNSLDDVHIPGPTQNWYLQNLISNNYNATTFGVTDGSNYTAYQGYKGNGSSFGLHLNYNPFGGGTFKMTSSDAYIDIGMLDDEVNDAFDIGSLNSGGTQGTYLRPRRATTYRTQAFLNDGSLGNEWADYIVAYVYGFHAMRKVSATDLKFYHQGILKIQQTMPSGVGVNAGMNEFSYLLAPSTNGGYSVKGHNFFAAGNSNCDPAKVEGIFVKYWATPRCTNKAKLNKRMHLITDSFGGDPAFFTAGAGAEMTRRSITQLNATPIGWIGCQDAVNARQLSTVNTNFATIIGSGRNIYLTRDLIYYQLGTNDLHFNTGMTAAQLKTIYDDAETNAFNAGFQSIIGGIIDRGEGGNQSNFDSQRSGVRTLMLAAYTISTGITGVWKNSNGNYYIDFYSDAAFQDHTNGTYYADGTHPTTTGYDRMIDNFVAPTIALFNP